MGQEICFFLVVCLFVFLVVCSFYTWHTVYGRRKGKRHSALMILRIFGLGDGHTQCMKKSLFNPSNSTVLLQDSLVNFFSRTLLFHRHVSSFLPSSKHGDSPKLLLWAFSSPKTGEMGRCALERGVLRTLLPECQHPHMYIDNEHICIHSLPQKTQYNVTHWCVYTRAHTRTHALTQLLPVLPLKPPSEASPWF